MSNLPLVNEIIYAIDIGKLGGVCCNGEPQRDVLGKVTAPAIIHTFAIPNTVDILCSSLATHNPSVVVAENVHTMPGQGVVSSGSLMQSKGELIGICAALGIDLVFIQPLKWIETFTLKRTKHFDNKNQWKNYLKTIAEGLCPGHAFTLKTTDAFLIWYYYARVLRGEAKPIGMIL